MFANRAHGDLRPEVDPVAGRHALHGDSAPDRGTALTGIVVVRGGGAPLVPRRLPRSASASLGRRERHAVTLSADWAPKDLAELSPVPGGWLVRNAGRVPLRLESDWLRSGEAVFEPGALAMLQRGDHRLRWTGLSGELSVSVRVRPRRAEDARVPYVVDSVIDPHAATVGSYLGVPDAPMSAALRYRMAVLFRHLLEGTPEPSALLRTPAEFLGVPEGELEWAAHRLRRRLNVVRGSDLQSLEELGAYLENSGEITAADLDP